MSGLPPQDRDWEDLLYSGPDRDPQETADEVRRSRGIGVPRTRYQPPDPGLPDVSGLAARLFEEA